MKKALTALVCFCTSLTTFGQADVKADFEHFSLPADSFYDGRDGAGGFASGSSFFYTGFNTQFNYWESGWAYSNRTDSTVSGSAGIYTSINGSGHESNTYAIGQQGAVVKDVSSGSVHSWTYVYLTNNAYAYHSMKNGDAFAKKFGGVTGNDPDYLLLTIKGWDQGNLMPDSVNFYLADFRDNNNSNDYIVDSWTQVNLDELKEADSLVFHLTSSDTGAFGMNTPGFFCLDKLAYDGEVSVEEKMAQGLRVYPNPASGRLVLWNIHPGASLNVTDIQGRQLINAEGNTVDVSGLPTGIYVLRAVSEGVVYQTRFVKE